MKPLWSKIRKPIIYLFAFVTVFTLCIGYATRNNSHMNLRQRILKIFYPILMGSQKLKKGTVPTQSKPVPPKQSFYALASTGIDGKPFHFEQLRGKKVLLVNTASECGYTGQYAELQKLYETFADQLVILGFPSNDFKQQEKGSNEEIATFCQRNFGVRFPLMEKSVVKKSQEQNPVFYWLTHAEANGWNQEEPGWNFTKYLVNEQGFLTHVWPAAVSPTGTEIQNTIPK